MADRECRSKQLDLKGGFGLKLTVKKELQVTYSNQRQEVGINLKLKLSKMIYDYMEMGYRTLKQNRL